ncbi:choice-of-anchor B family protein [Crocinitomix sp.]|nr:choice-of-anchor B family protein [Crocinitomix sp.]
MKYLALFILLSTSFLNFAQFQKNVTLLDQWADTSLPKGSEDAVYNDVWGFYKEGRQYCVMGSSQGTHFFEIVGDELVELDFEPGAYQSPYVVHRDFKIYKNYLYAVCDEGTSSLQIFDISHLPDSASKVYDKQTFFQICHNIYIDTLNAKLYACGANNAGMQVLDISDPINPVLDYVFHELPYVHDCYVRNDTAFLNCGFDGLYVYDFSGDTPAELGILDFYPAQGYNHSGWLSPDGRTYAFIDETKGTKVKICRWTTDLSAISIVDYCATRRYQDYVPHNVILLDNLAFVAYYNEGFRVYDISRGPFREIGMYDTFPTGTNYKLNGAWGIYVFPEKDQIIVSDRQNGLFLFSFPIRTFNSPNQKTYVSSTPFITANSILVPRTHLGDEQLTFSITTIDGKVIYEQENYKNYVNIPLNLAAGTYAYVILDEYKDLLEAGKFVIGN